MATIETKTCDIFGTHEARRFRIRMEEVGTNGDAILPPLIDKTLDLGARAKDRACKFIERALTKPTTQEP